MNASPPGCQDATTGAGLFSAGWLLVLNIGIAVVAIQRRLFAVPRSRRART